MPQTVQLLLLCVCVCVQDGYCHVNKVSVTAKVESYVNVTSGDVEALRQALAAHGPAQVSIDASHRSFSFYSNGVYYDPACKNGELHCC